MGATNPHYQARGSTGAQKVTSAGAVSHHLVPAKCELSEYSIKGRLDLVQYSFN